MRFRRQAWVNKTRLGRNHGEMAAIKEQREQTDYYFSAFSALEARRAQKGGSWFDATRREAMEHFGEAGFPTTRLENWKYTSVQPIARTAFQLEESGSAKIS